MENKGPYPGNEALPEETKDRTKLIWIGVILVFVAMVLFMWLAGRPDPSQSVVRAKHILVSYEQGDASDRARAYELAVDLRKRLAEGESFAKLAKDYSDDPGSASRGGDLGFFEKGAFVAGFEDYVWSAPVGELSEVISTAHGFHVIVVAERHLSDADAYEMKLEEQARDGLNDAGSAEAP